MLLKGENIPSSEGFPGQEDSSVEERQVSAEPHAPHLFPLKRFLVQPQGNVLAMDPQVHGKHALDLGTQPVDRIEETMGSRFLRVHRLLPAPGEAAAEVPHVVIDAGAGAICPRIASLESPVPASPRLFLPFRTDIGALMYVWSTQTSPESTVFPAFSGILCIFRFHRRAVCSDTCAWCAACLRVAPSESMETSLRIWDGLSLDE